MKSAVSIVLLFFTLFLALPTIIGVIEKSCDTSIFYSMTEEELSHKEVKANIKFQSSVTFAVFALPKSAAICSENLSKHDNVWASIFIPPPEQV